MWATDQSSQLPLPFIEPAMYHRLTAGPAHVICLRTSRQRCPAWHAGMMCRCQGRVDKHYATYNNRGRARNVAWGRVTPPAAAWTGRCLQHLV